jgi:hypothetical protein
LPLHGKDAVPDEVDADDFEWSCVFYSTYSNIACTIYSKNNSSPPTNDDGESRSCNGMSLSVDSPPFVSL